MRDLSINERVERERSLKSRPCYFKKGHFEESLLYNAKHSQFGLKVCAGPAELISSGKHVMPLLAPNFLINSVVIYSLENYALTQHSQVSKKSFQRLKFTPKLNLWKEIGQGNYGCIGYQNHLIIFI